MMLLTLLLAATAHAAEPALPAPLASAIHEAVVSEATAARQKALGELLAWTKSELKLTIDWSTVASLDYHIESDGSKTDATDPKAIHVSIGWNAFNCDGDAYSVFRHELVHVAQHQGNREQLLKRGWGILEIEAYFWELDHAAETGLDRCDRMNGDKWDVTYGVARAMEGLFRYIVVLETEIAQGQSTVGGDELQVINRHVGCAARRYPQIVKTIYPELDWSQLPDCLP